MRLLNEAVSLDQPQSRDLHSLNSDIQNLFNYTVTQFCWTDLCSRTRTWKDASILHTSMCVHGVCTLQYEYLFL